MTDDDTHNVLSAAILQQQTTATLLDGIKASTAALDARIGAINDKKSEELYWLLAKVLIAGMVGFIVLTGLFAAFYAVGIASLRTERDNLQANIDILQKQGKGIDFGICGDKREICAKLKNPEQSFKGGYYILKP